MPIDKVLRKFTSHEEARAETYRYWHTRLSSEIFKETAEMSEVAYAHYYKLRGIVPHAEGPARSLTRVQRTSR
jgi:hypothetical protein